MPVIVNRIVANIGTNDLAAAKPFYQDILGLDMVMDLGFIMTYGSNQAAKTQISVATEGGSNTPVPDLSIEVNDVDLVFELMKQTGYHIEYDITDEPWGVRRFYVRDPFGKLVNILTHS